MREKSSSVLTSRSMRWPLRCTVFRAAPDSDWPGEARASSVGPSINVSGVRNSWLTLEKNAVLARSSWARSSARWRAASRVRALVMPVPTWLATSSRKSRYWSSISSRGASPTTSTPMGKGLPTGPSGTSQPAEGGFAARQPIAPKARRMPAWSIATGLPVRGTVSSGQASATDRSGASAAKWTPADALDSSSPASFAR